MTKRAYWLIAAIVVAALGAVNLAFGLEPAGVILRTVALVLSLCFAIRYWHRPWRKTPEGRHLMRFTLMVTAFMALADALTVATWLGFRIPGAAFLLLLLYTWVVVELWVRNRLLTLASRG